ncbi:hypothetical protein [Deinococcus sp. JMULE3]|uniref:hypothetical protein n=1 Tax=Deinococcus sp. JMULE3 TaxID=2518341 RepID=UPI001575DF58|nr:hypothetical protein [Deinococcus sp. JMULE3]NTY02060.1 hypothetical protein [Deinococcus sp. JMULE3]
MLRDFTAQERRWYWILLGLAIVFGLIGRINDQGPAGSWWFTAFYSVGSLFALLLVRVTYRLVPYNRWLFPLMCLHLVGTLLALKSAIEKAVHS